MSVRSLTWEQVCEWRLEQHCLSPRLGRGDFLQAATRTGGIQAQVMSAAELALSVRTDGLKREDVQSALWGDRTLIKTWAMRSTLHLITAADFPLYVAALSAYGCRDWLKYFLYFGITQEQYEAVIEAVPRVLRDEPVTREELAKALGEQMDAPELSSKLLASSWGSMWKASAWRGDLCFGPNRGTRPTFVRPSAWLGQWQPVEPLAAFQEIARRYLRACGPATPQDFALWWAGGAGINAAKKVFRSIEDELVPVEVEGWRALALRETLEPMQAMQTQGTVRLLPLFDAYVLGLPRNVEPVLPMTYKSLVFRPQGWISAVVLVNGRMRGVWDYEARPSQTVVRVRMFELPVASIREGLEPEVERLAAFWNTSVALESAE